MTKPLIMQSGTTITLQPSQEFSIGTYKLVLIGSLALYPDIKKVEGFTV